MTTLMNSYPGGETQDRPHMPRIVTALLQLVGSQMTSPRPAEALQSDQIGRNEGVVDLSAGPFAETWVEAGRV